MVHVIFHARSHLVPDLVIEFLPHFKSLILLVNANLSLHGAPFGWKLLLCNFKIRRENKREKCETQKDCQRQCR